MIHHIIDAENMLYRYAHVASKYSKDLSRDILAIAISSIRDHITTYRPDVVYWVRGSGISERRLVINEQYRNRDPSLRIFANEAAELVEDYLSRLGIRVVVIPGVESDDIIYQLVQSLKSTQNRIWIVSADKDFLQLIDKSTFVYSPTKRKFYDLLIFFQEFGFRPNQYVLYKSLIGDKSDNVEGVKGYGPVKAKKFLTENAEVDDRSDLNQFFLPSDAARLYENSGLMNLSLEVFKEEDLAVVRSSIKRNREIDPLVAEDLSIVLNKVTILQPFWITPFQKLS